MKRKLFVLILSLLVLTSCNKNNEMPSVSQQVDFSNQISESVASESLYESVPEVTVEPTVESTVEPTEESSGVDILFEKALDTTFEFYKDGITKKVSQTV